MIHLTNVTKKYSWGQLLQPFSPYVRNLDSKVLEIFTCGIHNPGILNLKFCFTGSGIAPINDLNLGSKTLKFTLCIDFRSIYYRVFPLQLNLLAEFPGIFGWLVRFSEIHYFPDFLRLFRELCVPSFPFIILSELESSPREVVLNVFYSTKNFRLIFRNFQKKWKPRELHPKFREFCSIWFSSQNFRNFRLTDKLVGIQQFSQFRELSTKHFVSTTGTRVRW